MTKVAVVAHLGKADGLGGGLPELRRRLSTEGVSDPSWDEVPTSEQAGEAAANAVDAGADLLLVWGGDGTVQRVVDAVAGSAATVGIMPAGTANLFATNLGIPDDLAGALDTALHGDRRLIDVGVLNGERFGVMAGAGFDAAMLRGAEGPPKHRWGQLAYVWSGARATEQKAQAVDITVDGSPWFEGKASCVLLGCFGRLTGGLVAFPDADPADGELEVGVVTAEGRWQWARVAARLLAGSAKRSPLTRMTRGRNIDIHFERPIRYELDGDARKDKRQHLVATVEPGALHVCVPNRPNQEKEGAG